MIIIIIIIIALKGANRDFWQSPHCAANVSNTWYEGTAQLFSLTKLKSHLHELYFIGCRTIAR